MIKDAEYRNGRVTLTWYNVVGNWDLATGIVRCHVTEDEIPGPYDAVNSVIVRDREYEEVAFHAPIRVPGIEEFRGYRNYLKSLGLKRKKHDRAKGATQCSG